MKKYSAMATAIVLALSLAACGCQSNNKVTEPTVNTTVPTTMPETTPLLPETMPTLETNIPDPSVDSTMPDMNDTTDTTDSTDSTGTINDGTAENQSPETSANSRMRRGQ